MPSNGNNRQATALVRPRYFPRQAVTAADLTSDQDYFRERLRRHNRLLHGCGVICGLLVGLDTQSNTSKLRITPGAAISPMGDEIEVPSPEGGNMLVVNMEDFCFMVGGNASTRVRAAWPPPGQDPCPDGALTDQIYYLGLCYHQVEKKPRPVLRGNCYETTACENARFQDSYQFVLLDSIDPAADCVLVDPYAEDPAWKAEYYQFAPINAQTAPPVPTNTPPILTRLESAIDFSWGAASPDPTITIDHFMGRWTRQVYFPAGRYRFIIDVDDGVRLKIDNQMIIDSWVLGPQTLQATVTLPAGLHNLNVEYFEMVGGGSIRLHWEVLETGWYAEYFPYLPVVPFVAPTFPTSSPALTRIDPSIGFEWGQGTAIGGAGDTGDSFMTRWTRDIDICEPGMYEFVCRTDDGMRVFVDGIPVLDSWIPQSPTVYRPRIGLGTGRHRIRVDYYEVTANATAQVYWHQVGPYNPLCSTPAEGGCVVLAAVSVRSGQIQGVDNFTFDPSHGYGRKILSDTESLAARIACAGKPDLRPAIAQIVPGSGTRGTTVQAVIFGSRLNGVTAITFASTGLTGRILPGGTESWLPIEITIASTAALGPSAFTLITPEGALESAYYSVSFRVEEIVVAPTITPPRTNTFLTITPFTATFVRTRPRFSEVVTFGPSFTEFPVFTGGNVIHPGDIVIQPGEGPVFTPGDITIIRGGGVFRPILNGVNINTNVVRGGVFDRQISGAAPAAPRIVFGAGLPDVPILSVKGVGATIASRLEGIGITTANHLANAEPQLVAEALGGSQVRAMSLIDSARRTLENPG